MYLVTKASTNSNGCFRWMTPNHEKWFFRHFLPLKTGSFGVPVVCLKIFPKKSCASSTTFFSESSGRLQGCRRLHRLQGFLLASEPSSSARPTVQQPAPTAAQGPGVLYCESCLSELGAFIISIKAPVLALLWKNGSIINGLTLFFQLLIEQKPEKSDKSSPNVDVFQANVFFLSPKCLSGWQFTHLWIKKTHTTNSLKWWHFLEFVFSIFSLKQIFSTKKNINKVQGGPLLVINGVITYNPLKWNG